jgi:F-type H+-transporting ATPase subunit a
MKYRGIGAYVKRFFGGKTPLELYIGSNEFVSEFVRIISFSFRLFGNVFAGEVLITTILFLTILYLPFLPIIPLPFYALEIFVGIIQALIFSFLTIVFAGIATSTHEEAPAKVTVATEIKHT